MEEVKSHAQANWTNQPSRDAQNSEMMYHFLFESLGVRIQALYAILVCKRPHKSNEALPARITIPNHRSDFLAQMRTLSTRCWVLVL